MMISRPLRPSAAEVMSRAANVAALGVPTDGSVDVTEGLQGAWTNHGLIHLPPGTYKTSATLIGPATDGAGIIGEGSANTTIISSDLTHDVIQSHDRISGPIFKGLKITRTAQATTGFGLNMNPTSTNDWAFVHDLWLLNHAVGINLGSTGYSVAQKIRSECNRFHGFQLVGQWQLLDLFAALNGGNGFHVVSTTPASSGQWRGLSTFDNAGFGMLVSATSSADRIEGLRISDSFFGGDAAGEIFLDTFGNALHTFTNVYCELQPADVAGIVVTQNNPDCLFSGCHAEGSGSGCALNYDGAGTLVVQGGSYITSGNGIAISGTRGKASIMGAIARSATGTGIAMVAPMVAASIIGCNASSIINTTATPYTEGNYGASGQA
jgi:hypothetical protein